MKNMRTRIFVAAFLLTVVAYSPSAAQSPAELSMQKADSLYAFMNYQHALRIYDKMYARRSTDVLRLKIARSLYKLGQTTEALVWYEKVENREAAFEDEDKMQYAQLLHSKGRHEEAMAWVSGVEESNTHAVLQASVSQLQRFYGDSIFYGVRAMNINTVNAEFAPAYYQEGVVYTSNALTKEKRKFHWDDSKFLNLAYSARTEENDLQSPVAFAEGVTGKNHDGPAAFYDDDRRMVFTRNTEVKTKENVQINRLSLHFATYDAQQKQWVSEESFAYNSAEYSTGHATISADGQLMIFASDMPGTLGQTDLYLSKKTENGWSQPVNLGSDINTPGKEMFPYLDVDGLLYFASNGHPGLGGLDIFMALPIGDDFTPAVNIGYPVNTAHDDFALIIKEQKGFFSSNRAGNDDLFAFTFSGVNTDFAIFDAETGGPLEELTITLIDKKDEKRTVYQIPSFLAHLVLLPGEYTFEVSCAGYEPLTFTKNVHRGQPLLEQLHMVALATTPPVLAQSSSTSNPGEKANSKSGKDHLTLTEPYAGDLLIFKTAENIDKIFFSTDQNVFELVERHGAYALLSPQAKHVLNMANTQTPLKETEQVKAALENNRFMVRTVKTINRIFYDFDDEQIRHDAQPELDKLAALLLENPQLRVHLGSHADPRGSDDYNFQLSQKRSEAAKTYLINKGIAPGRLITSAYGEAFRITDCEECTEQEFELERRAEFNFFFATELSADTISTVRNYRAEEHSANALAAYYRQLDKVEEKDDVSAKIALGAFKTYKEQQWDFLQDLGVVERVERENGLTYFFLGTYDDLAQADLVRQEVVARGIKDAFLLYFYGGERVNYNQLLALGVIEKD